MMDSLPRLILTDIDGVWTDGGMYYDGTDTELKKFHTYDSAGVLFAHYYNIPVGIITGEDTQIVARRAKKLNVDFCILGCKDKAREAKHICSEIGIGFSDIAYIGDDINDLKLLQKVKWSGAPNSAPDYIKKIVKIITHKKGGEGAFREFVETILGERKIQSILDSLLLINQ